MKHDMYPERAFTLLEVIVTMSLVGLLCALVPLRLSALYNRGQGSAEAVVSYLRSTRALAMARTETLIISPTSSTELGRLRATSCSDPAPVSENFTFKLPHGVRLADTSWSVCFTSRGLSNASQTFAVVDSSGTPRTIEIALGGGLRIL